MDKSAFFAATQTLPRETVAVPGYGELTVRGLTGAEYSRFEEASAIKAEGAGLPRFRADRGLVARLGVIDGDGRHVFDDADLDQLRAMPAAVLNPVVNAVMRLSGQGSAAGN